MSKIILKLNEKQQGLKLIQVNDGFVVVKDTTVKKEDGWCWDDRYNKLVTPEQNKNTPTHDADFYWKIIFATPNLNLEGVPEIEEQDYEQIVLNKFKQFKVHPMEGILKLQGATLRFTKNLYKQAQQNLFTEEQMLGLLEICKESSVIGTTVFIDRKAKEYIQSLKQPKVEITFEDGKPVKCVML